MADQDIQFTISIPVREEDAENVINAFLSIKPYNSGYSNYIEDLAGNIIENPITPAMYVEDCIAYYILAMTKSYLIDKNSQQAINDAEIQADQTVASLKSWIDSL